MTFPFLKKLHQLEVVFFLTNLSVLFYIMILDNGYRIHDAIEIITFLFTFISLTTVLPSIIFHNMIKGKSFEVITLAFLVSCNLLSAFFWSHEATIQKDQPLYIIFFFFQWVISYVIAILSRIAVWMAEDSKH